MKKKKKKKNGTEVTSNLSPNTIGDDVTNFQHKFLLTNTQASKIWKAFANGTTANIKFSKIQLSKMVQSGEPLGKFLGPWKKTGLLLIGNVLKPLAKCVLVPLRLTGAASATDAAIQKNFLDMGQWD